MEKGNEGRQDVIESLKLKVGDYQVHYLKAGVPQWFCYMVVPVTPGTGQGPWLPSPITIASMPPT